MLKLMHLIEDRELALRLGAEWGVDEASRALMDQFRISSNAVYPVRVGGELSFLRFAPAGEKIKSNLLAELEFLNWLARRGYPAPRPLLSREGEALVKKDDPAGTYYASCFSAVPGRPIAALGLDRGNVRAWGGALGRLHSLAREYDAPAHRRWTHQDALSWTEAVLVAADAPEAAFLEAVRLREALGALPASPADYGLIHFDFEADNVLYDESTLMVGAVDESTYAIGVVDFDDMMYSWYWMDVENSLASIEEEGAGDVEPLKEAFLEGYRGAFPAGAAVPAELGGAALFRAFTRLHKYARIERSLRFPPATEPAWMPGLRAHLEGLLRGIEGRFGTAFEELP